MHTSVKVSKGTKLYSLGESLIKAGAEYWEEYQHTHGGAAVVWLEAENGNFILFTRGEYKDDILRVVPCLHYGEDLVEPFTKET